MSRLLHLVALLLVVLLPAGLLAACGGGGDEGSGEDVATVLQETFDGTGKKIESGKLDLSIKLDLQGAGSQLDAPIAIALSGPFENQGAGKVPRFDFSLNLDGSGQQFQAGAVSTGSAAYLRFADQAYAVGDATFKQFQAGYEKAAKDDTGKESATPSLKALGVDPRRWLKNPREVGTEKVGGADTIHLTADVDVARLLEDVNRLVRSANNLGVTGGRVPDELTPTERARAAEALKAVKVDLWTGREDKTLRRITLALDIQVPPAERKAAGLSSGKVDLEYGISDLNAPQKIEEPADARPIAELNAALQSLGLDLGAAAGASSGAGATSTTPQTSTQPTSQAYLDCLEQAGEDAAKVSACSKLLTQP